MRARSLPCRLSRASCAAAFLSVVACGSVSVRPPASGRTAAPRPAGCSVEFLRKPPEQRYDDLGELYGYWPSDVRPEDVLRRKACELGADAVIVTRDFLASTDDTPDHKLIAGTAIKYRDGR